MYQPVISSFECRSWAWVESRPVFRSITQHGEIGARLSSYAVALVVKEYAGALGLDAATYSGHSLRVALVTSPVIAGASERAIMNQTGHRSSAMVRRYIRDGSLFRENAVAKVGL
jgi:integrase